MEYKIRLRISNRHVHLTKETYDLLFDEELSKRNDLNQLGSFAANQTVTLRNGDKVIERVRIVGPLRNYNQIELAASDARILDLNPPVRRSSNLLGSKQITIETNKASLVTNGVIITKRHIHLNEEEARDLNIKDGQMVKIKVNGENGGIMNAEAKISKDGYYEAHLNTDDANAFLVKDNDEGILIV